MAMLAGGPTLLIAMLETATLMAAISTHTARATQASTARIRPSTQTPSLQWLLNLLLARPES